EDISELTIQDLEDLVKSLSEFDDHEVETNREVLKEILEAWEELRNNNSQE
ncbi:unnamed protein product, partial [Rotaria sp. Silwood2]